jgi:SAM-dependent methyltransferase
MTADYGHTYFDNPKIWSSAAWQWYEANINRARIAAEWLPGEVISVLGVGCGNGVFADLVKTVRFKVGPDLSRVALEHVTVPRL